MDAGAKVKIPALLMMILSALTILLNVVNILLNILGVGMGAMNGGEEAMGAVFQGGVGIGVAAISILFNAVVFFGAMKMKNLQGHTFALVSAVLFSLPCSACCLVNMPIGIWALIVLLNKDVKAAFQS